MAMGGRTWSDGFGQRKLSSAAMAGQLQLMQSPTFRKSAMTQGAFFSRPSAGMGMGSSLGLSRSVSSPLGLSSSAKSQQRSLTASDMDVIEVRALAGDAPLKGEGGHGEVPRGLHEALLGRLKSRAARQEAEKRRDFLATYRKTTGGAEQSSSDAHLDALLKALEKRAEELRLRSEELQAEVAEKLQAEAAEAERRQEQTSNNNLGRASETDLQALNPFERSQRRIQEDKREEEFQKQKDEVQAIKAKVQRRLQSELIELRDYKVLLREFRRVRLEKLGESLGKVTDGRRLRQCVRVMIRNGALRILQRLETSALPLEPWMREVLVNCCHVEIRIEDTEAKLLTLRRQALQPIRADVQNMLSQTKQERFDRLCSRTWELRQSMRPFGVSGGVGGETLGEGSWPGSDFGDNSATGTSGAGDISGTLDPWNMGQLSGSVTQDIAAASAGVGSSSLGGTTGHQEMSEKVVAEMRTAEVEVSSLRRLLADMRHNTASVICNQIRQADKGGGGAKGNQQAMLWGKQMLSLLVSEDFAKSTMKELQKLAPTAKMTQ
ncbi:unnamed protein product [Polarella glacialis]|uniref:Uncharacterized protein n=1 Tax=Polarella glacialis TaxID=89957 RepID=A0A813G3Y2_POLGL|nr:unnamed protein product [Polarella glacialis]|mmetsp:Transcript_9674/g.15333  ORF Transcript_9674/g.15333 Transcript_9674/m.15333 type:complete len:550 (-) Transcript_9674:107-1756(-)|eukprot:CAMPEP_0115081520 /NCGR_PEP_ID=MMETSP0227-20121206/19326_1 /TAXON_ID=89957 /ORGANISM="Polarella glacialis, Strain CCMP 1383" /LENGTH=549 /DNA_ID=CAMNT_0002469377 /DNA_START=74 /DNA_END=1723 /DNA_ORIENTATION=-